MIGELRLSEAVIEGGGPEKHQGVEVEPLQQSVGVDERLRKREFPAKRVKRNTERTRHKRSRSADAKKNRDPNYYHGRDFTNKPPVPEKNALHDHELHVPGYCPSMPPHFCPYHHHYHHHHPCYTFGSQYPTLSLPPPPPPSLVCPHCALAQQQQQQQQELEKQRAGKERGNHSSSSGPSQRCNSAPGVRMGAKDTDRTEQPLSSVASGGVSGDDSSPSLASGVKSIQLLAEDMLRTLQHSIDTVRKATGVSKCTGKF